MCKHYVYIVRCKDHSLYTGYTTNLDERVKAHSRGEGAKYTKGRGPVILVYHEVYDDKSTAMKREYEIKRWTKSKKEKFIITVGGEDV